MMSFLPDALFCATPMRANARRCALSALARLRHIIVTDDLAERSRERTIRALALPVRQQRKDEFGKAIRFFEMRIAGQNEGFNTKVRIFLHARRDLLRTADERRARAAAHEAHARPQVRIHLEVLAAAALAAMKRGHAPLTFRIHLRKRRLRPCN